MVGKRIEKVKIQRMFLLQKCEPTNEEIATFTRRFIVLGSVGKVFSVTISKMPWCSCSKSQKGDICKHIVSAPRNSSAVAAVLSCFLPSFENGLDNSHHVSFSCSLKYLEWISVRHTFTKRPSYRRSSNPYLRMRLKNQPFW